jgi:hypothetical protein
MDTDPFRREAESNGEFTGFSLLLQLQVVRVMKEINRQKSFLFIISCLSFSFWK